MPWPVNAQVKVPMEHLSIDESVYLGDLRELVVYLGPLSGPLSFLGRARLCTQPLETARHAGIMDQVRSQVIQFEVVQLLVNVELLLFAEEVTVLLLVLFVLVHTLIHDSHLLRSGKCSVKDYVNAPIVVLVFLDHLTKLVQFDPLILYKPRLEHGLPSNIGLLLEALHDLQDAIPVQELEVGQLREELELLLPLLLLQFL